MERKRSESISVAVSAYLVLILGALPLYMKDKLITIGDAKYYFYLKTAAVFVMISAAAVLYAAFVKKEKGYKRILSVKWSVTDWMVLGFGIVSLISWAGSPFKDTALWGFADWHMGLVTQLLLVWSYFFISRWYNGEVWIWKLAAAAACVVAFLGLANRYGYDPLGVYGNMGHWDWNRMNLLATIGNVNWFCGYLSTVFPISIYFFWKGSSYKRAAAGLAAALEMAAIVTQGSESGLAAMAVMFGVLLWMSAGSFKNLLRFLETTALLPIVCIVVWWSRKVMPRGLCLLQGSSSQAVLEWRGWFAVLLFLGGAYALIIWKFNTKSSKLYFGKQSGQRMGEEQTVLKAQAAVRRMIRGSLLAFTGIFLLLVMACQIWDGVWELLGLRQVLRFSDTWGNGRGVLWRFASAGFWEGSLWIKLFGAGPDCFAPYLYEQFDMARSLKVSGQWDGAVFANAHNEWLNMLVNEGLAGALVYLGIFLSGLVRFLRKAENNPLLGAAVMSLTGYLFNNLFSFQQVTAVPLVFAILAMAENKCRVLK